MFFQKTVTFVPGTRRLILSLLFAVLPLNALADIVDLGTITRDTATGLDWLDVTETANMSYNEVLAETANGGSLEGWRYATLQELDQLVINFGYQAILDNCSNGSLHCDGFGPTAVEDLDTLRQIVGTLGDTWYGTETFKGGLDVYLDQPGDGQTHGLYYSDSTTSAPLALIRVADLRDGQTGEPVDFYLEPMIHTSFGGASPASPSEDVGSFLVRPSAVPLPAAGWLFLSAVAPLLLRRRKRV